MTGIEVAAAGYAFAYLMRKARRAAGQADVVVDEAIDAGMERVHGAVSRALSGDHAALDDAAAEASGESGEITGLTRRRVELALLAAVQGDPALRHEVEAAVTGLRAAEKTSGVYIATGDAINIDGDVNLRADGGSIVALRMRDVRPGARPETGSRPD
ncbi:hypothetical protein ACIHEJ_39005 [Streptomyces sp. NPDC052301]|uniref:hypothetical protein n=1 Tax=Streptomyces sp. NPDC052301 TaxID=3365687 RepID=UPI0037CE9D03